MQSESSKAVASALSSRILKSTGTNSDTNRVSVSFFQFEFQCEPSNHNFTISNLDREGRVQHVTMRWMIMHYCYDDDYDYEMFDMSDISDSLTSDMIMKK